MVAYRIAHGREPQDEGRDLPDQRLVGHLGGAGDGKVSRRSSGLSGCQNGTRGVGHQRGRLQRIAADGDHDGFKPLAQRGLDLAGIEYIALNDLHLACADRQAAGVTHEGSDLMSGGQRLLHDARSDATGGSKDHDFHAGIIARGNGGK
jgi:hypothetical protein